MYALKATACYIQTNGEMFQLLTALLINIRQSSPNLNSTSFPSPIAWAIFLFFPFDLFLKGVYLH